jgi:hypothetical protein
VSFRETIGRGLDDHHTMTFADMVTHAEKADDLHHVLDVPGSTGR